MITWHTFYLNPPSNPLEWTMFVATATMFALGLALMVVRPFSQKWADRVALAAVASVIAVCGCIAVALVEYWRYMH